MIECVFYQQIRETNREDRHRVKLPTVPKIGEEVSFRFTDFSGIVKKVEWTINLNTVGGDVAVVDITLEDR